MEPEWTGDERGPQPNGGNFPRWKKSARQRHLCSSPLYPPPTEPPTTLLPSRHMHRFLLGKLQYSPETSPTHHHLQPPESRRTANELFSDGAKNIQSWCKWSQNESEACIQMICARDFGPRFAAKWERAVSLLAITHREPDVKGGVRCDCDFKLRAQIGS